MKNKQKYKARKIWTKDVCKESEVIDFKLAHH